MDKSDEDDDKVWNKLWFLGTDLYGTMAYHNTHHNDTPVDNNEIIKFYKTKLNLSDNDKIIQDINTTLNNKKTRFMIVNKYKIDKYIDEIRPKLQRFKKPAKYASIATAAALGTGVAYYTAKKLGYIGGKRRKLRRRTHRRKKRVKRRTK